MLIRATCSPIVDTPAQAEPRLHTHPSSDLPLYRLYSTYIKLLRLIQQRHVHFQTCGTMDCIPSIRSMGGLGPMKAIASQRRVLGVAS